MASNGNLPAYPVHEIISACSVDGNSGPYDFSVVHAGLSKREMFAMTAMQGLLAARDASYTKRTTVVFSSMAVELADSLLAELERTK